MPRIKREVQLHVACTIMPDLHPITKKDSEEKEICQFAASFKPWMFGQIPINQVEKAFDEFKESVIQQMRAHGILRPGH